MNVEKSRYIQVPAFLPARQIVFTVSIFIRWLILIFTPATEHACDEHHRIEQTGKNNGTANGGHEHAFCGWAGCDAENQDGQIQADENQCADECDDSFCFFFFFLQNTPGTS